MKIRKNIMITKELDIMVKEAANKYHTSESAVIEKAVSKLLAEDESQKKQPEFFDYAGLFDCEHRDLSVDYKNITKGKK